MTNIGGNLKNIIYFEIGVHPFDGRWTLEYYHNDRHLNKHINRNMYWTIRHEIVNTLDDININGVIISNIKDKF